MEEQEQGGQGRARFFGARGRRCRCQACMPIGWRLAPMPPGQGPRTDNDAVPGSTPRPSRLLSRQALARVVPRTFRSRKTGVLTELIIVNAPPRDPRFPLPCPHPSSSTDLFSASFASTHRSWRPRPPYVEPMSADPSTAISSLTHPLAPPRLSSSRSFSSPKAREAPRQPRPSSRRPPPFVPTPTPAPSRPASEALFSLSPIFSRVSLSLLSFSSCPASRRFVASRLSPDLALALHIAARADPFQPCRRTVDPRSLHRTRRTRLGTLFCSSLRTALLKASAVRLSSGPRPRAPCPTRAAH